MYIYIYIAVVYMLIDAVRLQLAPFGRPFLQKLNLEKWAQPQGDLNFKTACWSENTKWFWDLRPSVRLAENGFN